ncbi:TrmH family RNA methyltransferase [Amphibacillus jilinensis]|uniref:TrmH family RNA methyltransferase n=1 Tax=Amphibacillus jilinensis TaxID=1216008 RepID=UPI000308759C|nr:RNA methyltransferase [Amphibacillus jilinensis]
MITSVKNETIKNWAKLHQKKYREQEQSFIVEGMHLVEEAIKSDWIVERLIVQEGVTFPFETEEIPVTVVANNVLSYLAQTKSPQGILAIVKMNPFNPKVIDRILMLDAVQDPGNLGTMIRTADAAGFDQVILGEGTVDLYNDKVVRASQGSLFHLPIVKRNLTEEIEGLQQQGVVVCASTLQQAEPIQSLDLAEKMALIVGNEGSGIASSLLELADKRVHIPIYGQAESLNVSIAAAIMMYQFVLGK